MSVQFAALLSSVLRLPFHRTRLLKFALSRPLCSRYGGSPAVSLRESHNLEALFYIFEGRVPLTGLLVGGQSLGPPSSWKHLLALSQTRIPGGVRVQICRGPMLIHNPMARSTQVQTNCPDIFANLSEEGTIFFRQLLSSLQQTTPLFLVFHPLKSEPKAELATLSATLMTFRW